MQHHARDRDLQRRDDMGLGGQMFLGDTVAFGEAIDGRLVNAGTGKSAALNPDVVNL